MPIFDGIDIELSSKRILEKVIRAAKEKRKLVIVSYHNFKRTPQTEKLLKIINEARGAGADAIKLAAEVKGQDGLKRLSSLLTDHKDLIVIAMGAFGTPSRVFFPMLGSLITYAGISGANAPGQLSLGKLKSEFKLYGFK
jgi:3-dehydroquinate dehydratase-1